MPYANDPNDIGAELVRRTRDVAYVAVGLGVLGLQRAQALRHDLMRQQRADDPVVRLRKGVATGSQQIGEWLESTLSFVSAQLAPLGAELPEPARVLAEKARAGLETVGAQLRQLTIPGD